MAVAVKNPVDTKGRASQTRLLMASLVGAVYILGSFAAVFYGVPQLWATGMGWLGDLVGPFANSALRLLVEVAAAAGCTCSASPWPGPTRPRGSAPACS